MPPAARLRPAPSWRRAATWTAVVALALTGALTTPAAADDTSPTGSITGALTLPTGLDPATVTVSAGPAYGAPSWTTGTVDATGHYAIGGLADGTYTVRFSGSVVTEYYDDALDSWKATPVQVTLGQETSGIDATLAKGGSISGHVTVPDGLDTTGVDVFASESATGRSASARTQEDGSYVIRGLADGDYTVRFFPWSTSLLDEYWDDADLGGATPVAVHEAADVVGIDAELDLGGSISGTVSVPAGYDVTQTSVQVFTLDGAPVAGDGSVQANGAYTAGPLRAGTYLVAAQPTGTLAAAYYPARRTSPPPNR